MLEQAVGGVRLRLYVLMGAVDSCSLVACANAAQSPPGTDAGPAPGVRRARGVRRKRRRIIRQVLAESTLVAVCGGAAGVALAYWSLGWLRAFGPKTIPRLAEVNVDWRVLAFSLALSVGSGVVFGLVPALRVSRADLMERAETGGPQFEPLRVRPRPPDTAAARRRGTGAVGAPAHRGRPAHTELREPPGRASRLQPARRAHVRPPVGRPAVQRAAACPGRLPADSGNRLDRLPGVRASGGCTAPAAVRQPVVDADHDRRPDAAARRAVRQYRRARRGGTVFRSDGDSAPEGPPVRRPRCDRRARRGDRGRALRTGVLAGGRRGRQARPPRRPRFEESVADGGGRGRAGQAPVARRQPQDRDVPASRAGSDACDDRGRERDDGCRSPRRANRRTIGEDRCRPAALPGPHDGAVLWACRSRGSGSRPSC